MLLVASLILNFHMGLSFERKNLHWPICGGWVSVLGLEICVASGVDTEFMYRACIIRFIDMGLIAAALFADTAGSPGCCSRRDIRRHRISFAQIMAPHMFRISSGNTKQK